MKKCDYCAKEISNFEQYCCEECEQNTVRFYRRNERPPVGVTVATLSCFVLGAMLILLPFPTEGMIKKHKLKKAIKISRIFGGAVIGMGILIIGLLFVLE